MSRNINRAEAWESAHEIFTQVNFNAFDYNTIKESLLDYTKLYFPEDFNDYIESSEFIAILELFAYVGEILSYRIDMNAHENLMTVAQRKESILRLANFISYKPSRNIPARGLVKLTSVQTTENVIDSQGRNIANSRIIWNDSNDPEWKEHFSLIMNRILEQPFGTVAPSERIQVDDVLFELYTMNNTPISTSGPSVFKYSVAVNGATYPMEITPVSLFDTGPEEKRPERNAKMSLLYGSDGLGDGSDTTGFFLFTKQGELHLQQASFDGITPNQTHSIEVANINEIDVWLNNIDPTTFTILEQDPYAELSPRLVSNDLRYGEWIEVDVAHAQNIMFNTNKNRHKYELETMDNDEIRIIFGDGEFSDIPSGLFDVWFRTSANSDVTIPRSTVIDQNVTFSYTDSQGVVQSTIITFSLISSLQNASASEELEHVRRVAPSVYYTQDRMVNGRDYNTFMLQDPSIAKLRAVNRTFAGDSKYIAWHDPKEYYEDVKIFGEDLALYWNEQTPILGGLHVVSTAITPTAVLRNYLEPLLCSTDMFAVISVMLEKLDVDSNQIRCKFNDHTVPYSFDVNDNEVDAIIAELETAIYTTPIVDIYYSAVYDEWTVKRNGIGHPCDLEVVGNPVVDGCVNGPAESVWMMRVEARFSGSAVSGWDIKWTTKRLITHSQATKFWNVENNNRIINYDTLSSNQDKVIVLQANVNANTTGVLQDNIEFGVISQELVEQNLPNAGLPDDHSLSVLPIDVNNDNIPDNLEQAELINATVSQTYEQYVADGLVRDPVTPNVIWFPMNRTIVRQSSEKVELDIQVHVNGVRMSFVSNPPTLAYALSSGTDIVVDRINISHTFQPEDVIQFDFVDYVYFNREASDSEWTPTKTSNNIQVMWALDTTDIIDDRRIKRHNGRYPLNFAWMHSTSRFHLIDPAASNIIDMFVTTKGYYTELKLYLEDRTDIIPVAQTPAELRTSYSELINNKMISDTMILHPGKFKILFGQKSVPELQATFKVIRPNQSNLTDSEVKVRIVNIIRSFFAIDDWEYGETFYFTELAAVIHANVGPEIDSIVIVPTYHQNQFGDMFEIQAREDELFIPDITTDNITVVQSYTSDNIRQNAA